VEEVDDLEDGILDDVLADDILVLENEEEDGDFVLKVEQEYGILVPEDGSLEMEDDEVDDILVLVCDNLV